MEKVLGIGGFFFRSRGPSKGNPVELWQPAG